MKLNLTIPTVVFAVGGFMAGVSVSKPVSAEEIFVDAVGLGTKWEAECDRCTQNGNDVEISVEPGDVIVFRQSSFAPHGIVEIDDANGKKIRKLGEQGDSQIVVELGDGDTTKFGETFPGTGDGVEMTRIEVNDNFEGSLQLWCVLHTSSMTVTLTSLE